MLRRLPLVFAVLAGALLIGAGAVFAYDRTGVHHIAKGVTVGGVDVGDLSDAQAAAKLRRVVLDPLSEPIVVSHGHKHFRLTAKQAAIAVDIAGSVRAAVAASRDGNPLSRVVRRLSGGTVAEHIDLDIAYDKRAVTKLVRRVRARLAVPAVDASLDLERGNVTPKPSHSGRRLRASELRNAIERRLVDATAVRTVAAHTATVAPKVTTAQLAKKYPVVLIVNRGAFKLTIYKDLEPLKTYGIAVGQAGLETPAGLYHIQNKAVNPDWHVPLSDWAGKLAGKVIKGDDPANPIKARWMGIYDGAGIHGTDDIGSIGTAASHGCIRMRIPDVEELYDEVPVQAPVYIA